MNNIENEKSKPVESGITHLKKYGAPGVIFLSSAVLLIVAWLLWITHNLRAQGAAITLVGVVATHLVKEVQELLRFWLKGS
jgi:hypothetical protein